ncbi:MAG: succinate dehydrogenase, hydrophobic membrane anchor protein [Thalassobium sp.]|uniref:succinate dehydrogenase, hydrophobic membrane anchor protein n=1 Tax=Octadecabacter sp. SW4 TaxID=2602067 RepID=UPI000C0FE694|nr:succinate dehydrogenase, hydrophobic membrane anchor protein [Octadecabacter sp. SW4]PHQ83130.1 MAG: succinate dehydrogenase, hydrophobic membrane anchor protein [Thalassobium sp.]QEE34771.1 succinate dehydrogenase, hydrophobic membrane anchor protein [Octadecabacter sp. SW4]|tara:strand:+ start:295 stop:666 length:372 start_codon:yes stop_codon:yes gene_type:complete
MRFLTDRKRAAGLGSAKTGTEHHWHMMVTSVALVGLIPLFVFTFGYILGAPYDDVIAYYQRPFPAIIGILTLLVGFLHFRGGVQTLIEDYVHGFARKALIIAMICLSYTAAAVGIFAIVRIAL